MVIYCLSLVYIFFNIKKKIVNLLVTIAILKSYMFICMYYIFYFEKF